MQTTIEKSVKKIKLENVGIAGLKKELVNFEGKYKMSTKDFLKKVELGELAESNDFIDWLGAAELYAMIEQGTHSDI